MANMNSFALLGDNESDAPTLIATAAAAAAEEKSKLPAAPLPSPPATNPTPPAEAVRDAAQRGRGRGAGRGGYDNESSPRESYPRGRPVRAGNADGTENGQLEDGAPGGGYRGRGRGRGERGRGRGRGREGEVVTSNGGGAFEEDPNENRARRTVLVGRYRGGRGADRGEYRGERGAERGVDRGADRGAERGAERGGERGGDPVERDRDYPRRQFDRRNTTGRSFGVKRDGAGRGNWGTPIDPVSVEEGEGTVTEAGKEEGAKPDAEPEAPKTEVAQETPELTEEQKEAEKEEKEMTLDEYEKVFNEKRKSLSAKKTEERKVVADSEFEKMQMVKKSEEEDIFVKLGTDKSKKKEAEKEAEKPKKPVVLDFIKPDAENQYGGRGNRGRGRGLGRGLNNSTRRSSGSAPEIADFQQFPSLGGK